MIFHEIYSAYYNAVAKIISAVLDGNQSEKDIKKIVEQYAFGESTLTILPALKTGKWQLMTDGTDTPIEHTPTLPFTTLEKRWLKAISGDPRIKLFGVSFDGLEDVEPLFTEEDYYVYDKYSDGDPYDDEGYIERFGVILKAIEKRQAIKVEFTNRNGETVYRRCIPAKLEYSLKDDKFRMHTSGKRYGYVINLAKITRCRFYNGDNLTPFKETEPRYDTVTLEITDWRNAFERVMLHFAHFEKRAEVIDKRKYRLAVTYNANDVSEMVIRILSFGPLVKVTEPEYFVDLIKEKLKKQQNCGLK